MVEEEKISAFVAVDFPDSVIKEVVRIQEILSNKRFEGKLTELENLHLTLKFLGEIDEEKLDKIKERLGNVKFEEMDLRLSEVGTFNYMGNPRIVWIKVNGKGIFELQKKIDEVLKREFELEKRFMSHMTIARIKHVKDKKDFIDYVGGIGLKDVKFKVDRFKLMKSELRRLGPVYLVIEEYNA